MLTVTEKDSWPSPQMWKLKRIFQICFGFANHMFQVPHLRQMTSIVFNFAFASSGKKKTNLMNLDFSLSIKDQRPNIIPYWSHIALRPCTRSWSSSERCVGRIPCSPRKWSRWEEEKNRLKPQTRGTTNPTHYITLMTTTHCLPFDHARN